MAEEIVHIRLSLNNMEEMFAEPAADPFDPDSRYLSGIDEIVGQLRLQPQDLDKKSRLVIKLPQTAVSPDTQSTLQDALNRYSAAMIAENEQAIQEIRVRSRRLAISSFIIVAVIIFFTILLVSRIPGLQQVSGAIAGFAGIAIWVIFWEPIYNFVYAWRPNRLDIRVFENLRTAELVIEEE